jgi:hypothetical protein
VSGTASKLIGVLGGEEVREEREPLIGEGDANDRSGLGSGVALREREEDLEDLLSLSRRIGGDARNFGRRTILRTTGQPYKS